MCVFLRRVFLILSFFISYCAFSQHAVQPVNSATIIEKGISLYNGGKFKEAISVYKEVPRSDTNYHFALNNISLSYYSDSNFLESKKYAEEGLKLFPEKADDWYNLIANNLEKLGKEKEAITYYDKIIEKFNNAYIPWYNKGITYYNMAQFEEAKKCFQQSILINPYYTSAHYFLGNVAYNEGNMAAAMLSYTTVLVLNPEHKYSRSSITMLNNISKMNDEVVSKASAKRSWGNDNFEMVQEILVSKISFDKQYKIQAHLEDAIVRQLQVVFEKMAYNKDDKGFWMQFYVPFYEQLFKQQQFEPLVYYMFSAVDIKEIKAYVKNNKKKIEGIIPYINTYFNEVRETQTLNAAARKDVTERYFISDGKVIGKGKVQGEGAKALLVGPWEFYYENGQLKSKGVLNDKEEKMGEWLFYHENGQLKEKGSYKNNLAEGKVVMWFTNGEISSEGLYVNGELQGEYIEKYYNGLPLRIGNYVTGKKNGIFNEYTSAGTLDNVSNYKDDKLEGTQTNYYKNGKVYNVTNYKNGELHGSYKAYYLDGTLSAEGDFIDGKRTGQWKIYYNNNKPKTLLNYIAGETEGEFKQFNTNGTLMVKGSYVHSKLEGKYEDFDTDGKVYSESFYEKGRLKEIKFFDKEGKTISNVTTRNGSANLVYYDGYGNKASEGYFTKDGLRDGKTTYFYRNGKTSNVSNYKEGMLNGEKTSYFANGNISEKVSYKEDVENGYKVSYYANGKIKDEATLVNGSYDGLQIDYNVFGQPEAKRNYSEGNIDGYVEYYHPNGKINYEQRYSSGWVTNIRQFDTLGNVLTESEFEKGNGTFELKTYSGVKSVKGSYKNHQLHGEYRTFFPDGSTSFVQYYKYGSRDSVIRRYYYGGQLEYEGKFKMDEKDGQWSYYHENGKLNYTETYNNGRLNGVTKLYNDDGTVDKEMPYSENHLDGAYKIYGEDDQLAVVLNYEEGRLTSYTYEDKTGKLVPAIPVKNGSANVVAYYRNGNKSIEFNFEEDVINGTRKIHYSNGKVYVDGSRLLGSDDGVKKVYYPSGQLSSEENYYYGNLHGPVKKYFQNGKLEAEENWFNGNQHGTSKYYDQTGRLTQTRQYYFSYLQTVK